MVTACLPRNDTDWRLYRYTGYRVHVTVASVPTRSCSDRPTADLPWTLRSRNPEDVSRCTTSYHMYHIVRIHVWRNCIFCVGGQRNRLRFAKHARSMRTDGRTRGWSGGRICERTEQEREYIGEEWTRVWRGRNIGRRFHSSVKDDSSTVTQTSYVVYGSVPSIGHCLLFVAIPPPAYTRCSRWQRGRRRRTHPTRPTALDRKTNEIPSSSRYGVQLDWTRRTARWRRSHVLQV